DLFSLGVVLYRMCTARLPFQGASATAVLTALALDTPTPPHWVNTAVPAALAELVMQLLAKSPAIRPATAGGVARRLKAVGRQQATPPSDSEPTAVQPPPTAPASQPRANRTRWRRWPLVAAGVVAVLALLPLGYFLRSSSVPRDTSPDGANLGTRVAS